MGNIKPIYKKLLIIAIAIYIIGTTIMLSDMCHRVGEIEHILSEMSIQHSHHR